MEPSSTLPPSSPSAVTSRSPLLRSYSILSCSPCLHQPLLHTRYLRERAMEASSCEVVIVGAGLAGLAVAVGLHRVGLRSLVLESSDTLRAAGFALTTWTNAWRALDELGVGDSLREQHVRLDGMIVISARSGSATSKVVIKERKQRGDDEVRCVRRNLLVEALAKELPEGSIRCSSKVVAIEEAGKLKLLHLADGSTLKAKVLIGCDGINSTVAKWLGLKAPTFSGRYAARGIAIFPGGHGIKPEFMQYFGEGYRAGMLPCDDRSVYWFFTWTSDGKDEEMNKDAIKVREFVLGNMKGSKVPEELLRVVEKSELSSVASSPLKYRSPFHFLFTGDISRGNVCVTGDAFHPMTPDLGQGGCSALEDGVVLAKCLGEALRGGRRGGKEEEEEHDDGELCRIEAALKKFVKARRWRAFDLVATSFMLGLVQEGSNGFLQFVRDHVLSGLMTKSYFSEARFDFGRL